MPKRGDHQAAESVLETAAEAEAMTLPMRGDRPPMFFGQVLPHRNQAGQFVTSAHWTQKRVAELATWQGACRDALRRIAYTDEAILRFARIEVASWRIRAAGRRLSTEEAVALCDEPLSPAEEADAQRLAEGRRDVRDYLQRLAAASGHAAAGDALLEWALRRSDLLLRLADATHIPTPPADLLPARPRPAEAAA